MVKTVCCPQTNQQIERLDGVWRSYFQVFKATSHSLHSQTQSACDQLSLDTTMCVQSRSVQKHLRDCWLDFPHDFRHFPCPHLACCKQKQCSHFRSKGHLQFCKVNSSSVFSTNLLTLTFTWLLNNKWNSNSWTH